jgi:hypothetical protein
MSDCSSQPSKWPPAYKRYTRDFLIAMTLYTIVLTGSIVILNRTALPAWGAIAIAIAPVAPVLLALRGYLVLLGSMDELQRRMQHESIIIAAGLVGFGTFAYGFLENVGFPHLNVIFVLPAMIAAWGVASAFVRLRYR